MAKVVVNAKLVAAEGKRDEVLTILKGLSAQVQNEPGTEIYVLHNDPKNPSAIWVYEVYTDRDAFKAHASSDAMQQANAQFAGLLATTEVSRLEPFDAKGISI